MQVKAKLNNLRISPRKVRLVADLIRGLDVNDALNQIEASYKRGSLPMKKLILSAIGNGENNLGIDRNNMYIVGILVDAGPSLKRWMPKAYGRASQILKRTSQVEVILGERVEGKGRKSQEELEKAREKRIEEKMKREKAMRKEVEEKEASLKDKKESSAKVSEKSKEKTAEKSKVFEEKKGKGWASRIFRRKSM
jgi:large subunit ribosomal protein L22